MGYEDILEQKRKDYSPVSSPARLEEFIGSVLHQDFKNEIATRIEQMRDYYEDCNKAEYLETRGGIKLLRLVDDIFENLRDNAIADLESDEETQNVETV